MKKPELRIRSLPTRLNPTYQVLVDGTVVTAYTTYDNAMFTINKLLGLVEGKWPSVEDKEGIEA